MRPDFAVIIKSSRRPWALDRLLRSLELNLEHFNETKILVVDDRTKPKYLQRISEMYPNVDISFGTHENNQFQNLDSLPYVEAWKRAASSLSCEYILVLEDDQWINSPIPINEYLHFMRLHQCLSLFMSMQIEDAQNFEVSVDSNGLFLFYMPRLVQVARRKNKNFLQKIWLSFLTNPHFVGKKILALAMLLFPNIVVTQWRDIASINPMCGAIFKRSYWLKIWDGASKSINENLQISRIIKEIRELPEHVIPIATTSMLQIDTTYVSSISWNLGLPVDWNLYNECWSTAWYTGELTPPEHNFDWEVSLLSEILRKCLGQNSANLYIDWVAKFRKMHRKKLK